MCRVQICSVPQGSMDVIAKRPNASRSTPHFGAARLPNSEGQLCDLKMPSGWEGDLGRDVVITRKLQRSQCQKRHDHIGTQS